MDLKIEESWLYDVWEFYLDVVKKREERANLWQQGKKVSLASATSFEGESILSSIDKASLFLKEDKKSKKKKIYVRLLILGSYRANFSYFKSAKGSWASSDSSEEALIDVDRLELFPSPTPMSNGQQSAAADDAYRKWSENMTDNVDERSHHANINIISAVFPSISEAPIRFEEKIIEHVYESDGDIWRSLKSFYSSEALRQIYKIAGSLDFVGNHNHGTDIVSNWSSRLLHATVS